MATALPDDVVEVGSVHISVGMGEDGTGCAYEYDGLSPEAAIGYVTTVLDQLQEEVRERWETARNADFEFSVQLECPECGERIRVSTDDDDEAGEVE